MNLYQELYEAATGRNNAKIKAEYDSIVKNAREVASNGGLYLTRGSITPTVKEMLEGDGLTVQYLTDETERDCPSYYKISWETPRTKTTYATDDYWRNR